MASARPAKQCPHCKNIVSHNIFQSSFHKQGICNRAAEQQLLRPSHASAASRAHAAYAGGLALAASEGALPSDDELSDVDLGGGYDADRDVDAAAAAADANEEPAPPPALPAPPTETNMSVMRTRQLHQCALCSHSMDTHGDLVGVHTGACACSLQHRWG
jgi:hypothetical protein